MMGPINTPRHTLTLAFSPRLFLDVANYPKFCWQQRSNGISSHHKTQRAENNLISVNFLQYLLRKCPRLFCCRRISILLHSATSVPTLGLTQSPNQWIPEIPSFGERKSGHEADDSSSSTEVKKSRAASTFLHRYSLSSILSLYLKSIGPQWRLTSDSILSQRLNFLPCLAPLREVPQGLPLLSAPSCHSLLPHWEHLSGRYLWAFPS
jgi:hypothetical protein